MNLKNGEERTIEYFYSVLNVASTASDQEIKEAYFKLKNTFASNNQALYSLVDDSYLAQTVQEIELAYKALSETKNRNHFEQEPAGQDQILEATSRGLSNFDEIVRESAPRNRATLLLQTGTAKDPQIQAMAKKMIAEAGKVDGSLFKALRELFKVQKSDIQDHVKISLTYIDYIEENRFDFLPQPIYVKGFVNSYLTFLGVPEKQKLCDSYMGTFNSWLKEKEN